MITVIDVMVHFNKKSLLLFFWISFCFCAAFGQQILPGQYKLADMSGGLITEIPFIENQGNGEIYILDDWQIATIELTNGTLIENYPIKYEVNRNHIEILTDQGVKILPGNRAKVFTWINPKNGSMQSFWQTSFLKNKMFLSADFYEILLEGNVKLYRSFKIKEVKSNYVAQLDVGTNQHQMILKSVYFIDSKNVFGQLSKNLNNNRSLFGKHFDQIKRYVRANRLKLHKESDCILLTKYLDKLIVAPQ